MIPVHMGVVAPNPTVLVSTPITIVQKPVLSKKEPDAAKSNDTQDSGPTTTVFVGNISDKVSDLLVRQLLAKCGVVLSWKRVQGASGKLQAFGFCEYKQPESTLRALRLLHELHLGDKKLLVKVDAKTKAQLDEWKANKSLNGETASEPENGEEEALDEKTLHLDQDVKAAIAALLREYATELTTTSQDDDSPSRNKKRKEKKEEADISAIEIEDDKRDLISREISKFRDTHKKLEEEKGKKEKERLERDKKERDKEEPREQPREQSRDHPRDHPRERRDREKDRERERDKERERDRDRDRERDRTKDREKERGRSQDINEDRDRFRERSRDDKKGDRKEDEGDIYERRRLERRLRDKEAAYQERLKNWEIREKKKARDYEKEMERDKERRRERIKEAKRLKEFLEDYDDNRDDLKYYRGSALQKRLRDREKEVEVDERDRKREKEELEEIRRRLLAEGHPDPDSELQRMEEEAERRQQSLMKIDTEEKPSQEKKKKKKAPERPAEPAPRSHKDQSDEDVAEQKDHYNNKEDSQEAMPKPVLRLITTAPSVSSASGNETPNSPGNESPWGILIPDESIQKVQVLEEHRPKIGLSLKLGATNSPSQLNAGKRKKLDSVESVFNKFDDEEGDEKPRKRKLVPLDYGEDKNMGLDGVDISASKSSSNTEEKRKHIVKLIEKIPTGRSELFTYPLDWTMVDSTLMDRCIRPWIRKKIAEYIGEEEPSLVDFVCSKIMAHSSPQGILDDVSMVLDEEAEVFIVKMWRLLIYETEAKKIGLEK